MSVLPSGLETTDLGTQGWNDIHTANMQLLDDELFSVMTAFTDLGDDARADVTETVNAPATTTQETLINSTGGTVTNTIGAVSGSGADPAINDNFASILDDVNKARTDNEELRTRLIELQSAYSSLEAAFNDLLAKLRKSTGNGVLSG